MFSPFQYQAPLALFAVLLIWWKAPQDHESISKSAHAPKEESAASKLRRVDFLGASFLATSIVTFLLILNLASKTLTILDPLLLSLCALWTGSGLLFLLVEAKYASEPIFPLQLLVRRDVLTAYLITALMIMGQMGVRGLPFRIGRCPTDRNLDVFVSSVVLSHHRTSVEHCGCAASASILGG